MALYNYIYILYNYIEIDNMQELISLNLYLLFFVYMYYLLKIDERKLINLVLYKNSKNDNKFVVNKYSDIQSAENIKEFSETIRQSSNLDKNNINSNSEMTISNNLDNDKNFWSWFAGVLDGDGNFQIRNINNKKVIKTIEIKLHNRDIRILVRILDKLHLGRIYRYKNNPYSKWIISNQKDIKYIINHINGLIRLKVHNFKQGCECLNIKYNEGNYTLLPNDPYFSGLIDTDGSIVFNYSSNRIECNLELKLNEYSSKLVLDNVIPNYTPSIYIRKHKQYSSIAFKYQTVKGMVNLYEYFKLNRLYSDMKFYRVMQILKFIEIRKYQKYNYLSEEFLIYSEWLLNWIEYQNPKWYKVPFVSKLRMKK